MNIYLPAILVWEPWYQAFSQMDSHWWETSWPWLENPEQSPWMGGPQWGVSGVSISMFVDPWRYRRNPKWGSWEFAHIFLSFERSWDLYKMMEKTKWKPNSLLMRRVCAGWLVGCMKEAQIKKGLRHVLVVYFSTSSCWSFHPEKHHPPFTMPWAFWKTTWGFPMTWIPRPSTLRLHMRLPLRKTLLSPQHRLVRSPFR